MDLISRYANELTADDPPPSIDEPSASTKGLPAAASSTISSITTALIALLVSLTAGFIG